MRICPHCGHRGDEEQCPRDGYPTVDANLVATDESDAGAPPLVGQVFGGRYLVEALVGEGGMGWVFRANHTIMQHTVALKVMRRDVARSRAAIKRFFQEARACSRLRHPHTIKVHDFGVSDDGYPFLVMEYLDGAPLDRVLQEEGALPPERVVRIAAQMCKSLHEAHGIGIVHRDLKPSNVFLAHIPGEVDYVKVLDFGVAKFLAGAEPDGSGSGSLTRTGMVVGTPRYMAPEQIRTRPLDGRTDLYALGHLLFEMLTGRPVFRADSSAELMAMQLTDDPPPLDSLLPPGRVPPDLVTLVHMLLAKNPDRRPASAEVVLQRLQALGAGVSGVGSVSGLGSAQPHGAAAPAAAARGAIVPPHPARVASRPATASPSAVTRSPSLETSGERRGPGRRGRMAVMAAGVAVIAAAALFLVLVPRQGSGPASGTAPETAPETETTAAPGSEAPIATTTPGGAVAVATLDVVESAPEAAVVGTTPDVRHEHDADEESPSAPAATPDAAPGATVEATTEAASPDVAGAATAPPPPSRAADTKATAAAPPVEPPAAETRPDATLLLTTRPRGAKVSVAGKPIGKTPHTLRGAPGQRIEVTLERRGYETVTETVVLGDAPERSWTLERRSRAQPDRPPRGETPRTSGDDKPRPTLDIPIFQ